ncbi:hypothetical protein NW766_002468 [Fusarium irregulare]|uniref:Uncharacterized protein n=1 Tax=Fusarium irregulare TaxID=2494466 RepID=A0A9W8PY54_9HYPO|nr:hypothetical protein NW766_002468 [Fusarium irregulare]
MRHTGEIVKAQLVLQAVVVRYTTNRGFYKDGRVFWSHPWRQDIDKFKGGVFGRWLELDVQSDGESGSLDVALIPILAWYRENEQAQEETKDASKEDMNESTKSSTDYEIFHVAGLVLQCVDKSIFEHCSGELDKSEGGARDSWTVGREKESLTLV